MNYNIRGFIEVSFLDWLDAVCSIIFLPHCNFRCPYCHNADLVLRPEALPRIPEVEVFSRLRHQKQWIEGVVVTGGEPTLSPTLPQLLKSIHKYGLKVKLDTNGSQPEVIARLIRDHLVDYAVMDVKAPLQKDKMDAVCGVDAPIDAIKESIKIIMGAGIDHQFRTTFCPKFLTFEDLLPIAETIRGANLWTIQNFNNRNTLDPSLEAVEPVSASALRAQARRLAHFVRRLEVIA